MNTNNLVRSTSGVRGIVGAADGLEPMLVAQYAMAFGTLMGKGKVVLGRDSRVSGDMVSHAVISGLIATGLNVIDIGIVPTPTVEIAVTGTKAAGGICVTASHNPSDWNALKFFNNRGEFITPAQYVELNRIFESKQFALKPYGKLGKVSHQSIWIDKHIAAVLALKTVNKPGIKKRKFKVVVDAINGAGSEALPRLLEKLGVKVIRINCKGDGDFVHMPEPIPKHLTELAKKVKATKADLGMACDPDADRLVLVDENGKAINEELTLTIAVKQVLRSKKGKVVLNLSTSRVTEDVARKAGADVLYSKVGEANVVEMMHEMKSLIGGEGNGGVIYPACHAGRDASVGAALVLSCLVEEKCSLSTLVETFPSYYIIKSKAPLPSDFSIRLKRFEAEAEKLLGKTMIDRRDGMRFDFDRGWVQLRTSNTEPIFRLIVETSDRKLSESLTEQVIAFFR
jgi:phosphomannomutase